MSPTRDHIRFILLALVLSPLILFTDCLEDSDQGSSVVVFVDHDHEALSRFDARDHESIETLVASVVGKTP